MAKITLDNITGSFASVTALNSRFQQIEDAFNDNVFWRLNIVGEPNTLSNDLDMNNNDILNLNAPLFNHSPARLQDVLDASASLVSTSAVSTTLADSGGFYNGVNVEAALAELASVSTGEGASIIGIEDSAGNFTGIEVETALSEVVTKGTVQTITGVKTMTAPVLNLPVIATINGSNGEGIVDFVDVASAINKFKITSATTGNAVNIECTETNQDVNFERNGTGEISINSVPIYGMVILDTPITLATGLVESVWTTLDMSVAYAAAATAGAQKAIVKMYLSEDTAGGDNESLTGYVRKTGSGLAANEITVFLASSAGDSTGAQPYTAVGITTVNLDGNSDFDYYMNQTGFSAINTSRLVLIGYYV